MLRQLPKVDDSNVLVDFASSDDAGVYRLPDGSLLVATLDFFTPIVNNPYDYGAIAAANALSDIYAMGASPLFALNIIGFPRDALPLDILGEILQGGSAVAQEAGIFIIGGHSIDDKEPKYGMVVMGRIEDESALVRNNTGKRGDALILTKPLGTGIINTAIKHKTIREKNYPEIIHTMKTLNRDAADVARELGVHAMTDVTGFGLTGHLHEMLEGTDLSADITFENLPIFPDVLNLIKKGDVPGGTRRNFADALNFTDYGPLVNEQQLLAADAQTSGGFLVSLPEDRAEAYVERMHSLGHTHTSIIGGLTGRVEVAIRFR